MQYLLKLTNSILARKLFCDVQACSNLAVRQPPIWVGGIGRRPLNTNDNVPSKHAEQGGARVPVAGVRTHPETISGCAQSNDVDG